MNRLAKLVSDMVAGIAEALNQRPTPIEKVARITQPAPPQTPLQKPTSTVSPPGMQVTIGGENLQCTVAQLTLAVPGDDDTGKAPFLLQIQATVPRSLTTTQAMYRLWLKMPQTDYRNKVLNFLKGDMLAKQGERMLGVALREDQDDGEF